MEPGASTFSGVPCSVADFTHSFYRVSLGDPRAGATRHWPGWGIGAGFPSLCSLRGNQGLSQAAEWCPNAEEIQLLSTEFAQCPETFATGRVLEEKSECETANFMQSSSNSKNPSLSGPKINQDPIITHPLERCSGNFLTRGWGEASFQCLQFGCVVYSESPSLIQRGGGSGFLTVWDQPVCRVSSTAD